MSSAPFDSELTEQRNSICFAFLAKLEDDPAGECFPTMFPARDSRGGVTSPRPHRESQGQSQDSNPGFRLNDCTPRTPSKGDN